MLYVKFASGTIDQHFVSDEEWDKMGSMILWFFYDMEVLPKIERFVYVVNPPTGG